MFFKNYFLSVADCLDAKFRSYERPKQNPQDKGELCENFVKEFITDSLSDNFKVYRGGKIVDHKGNESSQLDIVLCGKRTLKLFGDKGIYPIETTQGVFSITATLDKAKFESCLRELQSIPKRNYRFNMDSGLYSIDYQIETQATWELLFPFKCIFAYRGTISADWLDYLNNLPADFEVDLLPDLVIVNKVGMIEKVHEKMPNGNLRIVFRFTDFAKVQNYGLCFSLILFHLFNLSCEDGLLMPDYKYYFEPDAH